MVTGEWMRQKLVEPLKEKQRQEGYAEGFAKGLAEVRQEIKEEESASISYGANGWSGRQKQKLKANRLTNLRHT